MKYVTNTLGSETKVSRLTPDQEIKRHVQELAAETVCLRVSGTDTAMRDRDLRFPAEVRAPGSVVLEQLPAEFTEDAAFEGVR